MSGVQVYQLHQLHSQSPIQAKGADPNRLFALETSEMESCKISGSNEEMETNQKSRLLYRCKKCRRIVASQENEIPHEQGEGEQCFKWKKRGDRTEKQPECSSIFVEPLKWMETEGGHVEEKLWCFGCKARLGSFNWAGMQCSCGAWVNPAFQLHKSRIDESTI